MKNIVLFQSIVDIDISTIGNMIGIVAETGEIFLYNLKKIIEN